jgi:hypothetical protein
MGRERRAGFLARQPRAGMTGKRLTLLGSSFSRVWPPRAKDPGLFRIRVERGGNRHSHRDRILLRSSTERRPRSSSTSLRECILPSTSFNLSRHLKLPTLGSNLSLLPGPPARGCNPSVEGRAVHRRGPANASRQGRLRSFQPQVRRWKAALRLTRSERFLPSTKRVICRQPRPCSFH